MQVAQWIEQMSNWPVSVNMEFKSLRYTFEAKNGCGILGQPRPSTTFTCLSGCPGIFSIPYFSGSTFHVPTLTWVSCTRPVTQCPAVTTYQWLISTPLHTNTGYSSSPRLPE